ncbi:hypothetical protein CPB84DRAFT_1814459 [Gymnopilus junonius]|uniref:PRA1 family protein n=1 Tax=Gymnopilus junonius TaxID=109634 RepID=A0A9P5NT54_GYMJU|nr:hypothetical protein CPB84DRAFT_1814459 [Gymnopilus junonius]
MEMLLKVTTAFKSLKETRLSGLRPVTEFFDFQRISRPADMNQATSRISYNTRYFSASRITGFSFLLSSLLEALRLSTNSVRIPTNLRAVFFFHSHVFYSARGNTHLYTALFVIGIPMFLWAGPFGTFFGVLVGSAILVLSHASLLEPGVESDYASIQDTV